MSCAHIVSVGISIVMNYLHRYPEEKNRLTDETLESDSQRDFMAQQIYEDLHNIYCREQADYNSFSRACSAEISTLLGIKPAANRNEPIYLISTDTPQGRLSAEINRLCLEDILNFNEIHVERIPGLKLTIHEFHNTGIPNLMHVISLIYETERQRGNYVVLNVSGGYKPISTFMTFAGLLLNIPVHYSYIEGEVLKMPQMPIQYDPSILDRCDIVILKKFLAEEALSVQQWKNLRRQANSEIFYLIEDQDPAGKKRAILSYTGKLVLKAFFAGKLDTLCHNILQRQPFEDHLRRIFSPQEKRRGQRTQHTKTFGWTLAIFDLDKFKAINDNYGHDAGDQALIRFAEILASFEKEYCLFGRYGGDEFMGLLPSSDIEQGRKILDTIRRAVEVRELHLVPEGLTTTIGAVFVSKFKPDPGNPKRYLKAADHNLVELKSQNKRNHVSISEIHDS